MAFRIRSLSIALAFAVSACVPQSATPGAQQGGTPAPAQGPQPVPVQLLPTFTGLNQPLYLTHAGAGSELYILEKGGAIRVTSGSSVRPLPFLDITSRVLSGGSEQGLLGLAFHPQFRSNGLLYAYFTERSGRQSVWRFTANADRQTADPNSGKLLLTMDDPFANHNGGMLAFGPDGKLWIGTGDGGSAGDPQGNAQNLGSLLGKLLRVDVDSGDPYGIPQDNPFVGRSGARGEIYAYGLRNPWRFSFDRATGDLFIGDVGQNAWEEVNLLPAGTRGGQNFGWNVMEASQCYPSQVACKRDGLILPISEYRNREEGCSVTGGYVYRGEQFPAMRGLYFFTDYCTGPIWSLTRSQADTWTRSQAAAPPRGQTSYSSFGEGPTGEIYVVSLASGTVFQIVPQR